MIFLKTIGLNCAVKVNLKKIKSTFLKDFKKTSLKLPLENSPDFKKVMVFFFHKVIILVFKLRNYFFRIFYKMNGDLAPLLI